MALLVGVLLAVGVGVFGTVSELDRERAFYTTIMIVIAGLYSLFAVMGGSTQALGLECLVGGVFVALALLGFRKSLWFVVVALGAHGVFDFAHPALYANPGVPVFWPAFCSAYDIVAAVYLAGLIKSGRLRAAR